MKKWFLGLSIILWVMSVASVLLVHLALTDIWHGESNTTLEWNIVRIGFVIMLLFHIIFIANIYYFVKSGS